MQTRRGDDAGAYPEAPEIDTVQWFNSEPLTLADLRGKVVVMHTFQMLCPGCVLEGTPLAQRLHDLFHGDDVAVIGLHTVFEHHAAMTPVSLEAYLYEFRITMPVGVDRPGDGTPIPRTMEAYALQGTPSLVLIDRQGRLRARAFGKVSEAAAAKLISELVH